MKAKALLIEGKRADRPSFLVALTKKGFQVESAPNGSAALKLLEVEQPHAVVVDADSMRTSGKRICQAIHEAYIDLPIILILGADAGPMENVDANVILYLPFTPQKLINRLRPFLPTKQQDVLIFGPIELDIKQRMLRCNGRQSRLTPRQVLLLRTLMERPGEVILREDLFTRVWDTNYTGDTRTLDVHISWLRQAIEEDPRNPQYLKTHRGVGYRLDAGEFTPPR